MEMTLEEVARLLGEKDIVIYQQAKIIEDLKKKLEGASPVLPFEVKKDGRN